MVSMSGTNAQIASNQSKANSALLAAQSGLEVLRYYLSDISLSGSVAPEDRLAALSTILQNKLAAEGASNIYPYLSTPNLIFISTVTLDSASGQTFTARITQPDLDTVQLTTTGSTGQIDKSIRVNYGFDTTGNPIFDYGVASKGPLSLTGQAEIEGCNLAIEASVYVEGDVISTDAFSISNNASVAGDVSIANPYATCSVGNQSSVGGATGEDVYDHIHIGVDYVDFPTPDPDHFIPYATGEIIDENSDWDNVTSLNNVTIKAGTNPTFASHVTINGVLFIETPNHVTFAGQSNVNGIIVGDGDLSEESAQNSLNFSGQVICNSVDVLTEPEFDAIKQETGTFIVAPGFGLDFSGQELHMSGAIAASGISFSGQAGGTIEGSLINYSNEPMLLSGQSNLIFDRSGTVANPAGFTPNHKLQFDPESYSEVSI